MFRMFIYNSYNTIIVLFTITGYTYLASIFRMDQYQTPQALAREGYQCLPLWHLHQDWDKLQMELAQSSL